MNEELKACPFCGSTASVYEAEFEGETVFIAGCDECGISTPANSNEEIVAAAWNKRVQ